MSTTSSTSSTPQHLVEEHPEVREEEAHVFVTEVLKEEVPEVYPPSLQWINQIIRAFHCTLPFQNITFLSKTESCCIPSWQDIEKDMLMEGKGGLCLSLNVAFAAVVKAFGVHAYLVPADYVATKGRSVHALTVFHLCIASSPSTCQCLQVEVKAPTRRKRPRRDPSRRSLRLRERNTAETRYCPPLMKVKCEEYLRKGSLYVADVGCGFPTLRAINLREDIDKPFVDCGLEYCFTNRHRKYLRLHRAGDEVPQGEEEESQRKYMKYKRHG